MNKKERRLALSTALHSAAGSTVTVRSLKVQPVPGSSRTAMPGIIHPKTPVPATM